MKKYDAGRAFFNVIFENRLRKLSYFCRDEFLTSKWMVIMKKNNNGIVELWELKE